ncbi:MAG: hypothetical protein ACI9KN_000745 [Gammaproteobacteria bacterium]|jgi:hypothetical protein
MGIITVSLLFIVLMLFLSTAIYFNFNPFHEHPHGTEIPVTKQMGNSNPAIHKTFE